MANERVNMQTIRDVAEQVFSSGKLERISELVHADFQDHSAPEGMRDRDGFRRIVEFWRQHASRFRVEVIQLFGSGEWVGMVDETSGVHDREDIFGVPPNGRPFRFQAVHAFRMQDGKMREHWVQTALPDVLRGWASA